MIINHISKNNFFILLTTIVVIITVVFGYSLLSSKQPKPKNIHIKLVAIPYSYQPTNLKLLINNQIIVSEFEKIGDTILRLEQGTYAIEALTLNDSLKIKKQFIVNTEDTLYVDIIYEHIPDANILIKKYKESYFNRLTRGKKYTSEQKENFKKSLDSIIDKNFLQRRNIIVSPKYELKIQIRDYQYITD